MQNLILKWLRSELIEICKNVSIIRPYWSTATVSHFWLLLHVFTFWVQKMKIVDAFIFDLKACLIWFALYNASQPCYVTEIAKKDSIYLSISVSGNFCKTIVFIYFDCNKSMQKSVSIQLTCCDDTNTRILEPFSI